MEPVTVLTPADVAAKRAAIKALIWPPSGGSYPTTLRPTVLPGYVFPTWAGLPNLLRIDRWYLDPYIGRMTSYHFRPTNGSGRTILYCDGHQFGILGGWVRSNIGGLLGAGFDVVYVPMPLHSLHDPAGGEVWTPPVLYGVTIRKHDDLPQFNAHPALAPFSYLQWFCVSYLAALNQATDATGRPTVSAMGISGGGLMAVLMAALDERIVRTYPVSAGFPPQLMPGFPIDAEYSDPALYGTCSLQDMYVLATSGGRRMVQLINEFDGAFSAGPEQQYAAPVAAAAAGMGGSWSHWIDVGQAVHYVSPASIGRIVADHWGAP